jgi:hypothetical protein
VKGEIETEMKFEIFPNESACVSLLSDELEKLGRFLGKMKC